MKKLKLQQYRHEVDTGGRGHIQRVPYFFVWQTAFRGSQRRQQSQTDDGSKHLYLFVSLRTANNDPRCSWSKTRENRRYGTLRPYLGHFTILVYLFGRTFYSVFCQLMQPQRQREQCTFNVSSRFRRKYETRSYLYVRQATIRHSCSKTMRDRRYGTSRPLSIYFLRVYMSCFIWMHILLFI